MKIKKSQGSPTPADKLQSQLEALDSLLKQGDFQQVIAVGSDLTKSHPKNPILLNILGTAYIHLDHLQQAAICLAKAIKFKPDFAEGYNNLGIVFNNLKKFSEATICYKKAIKLQPGFAEAHSNYGVTLKKQGKLQLAASSYQQALKIKPNNATALHNLGEVLLNLGKREEAISCYRKALSSNPELAETHRSLALIIKSTEKSNNIGAMEEIYAKPEITSIQKMHLAFGLGKSLEDLSQYAKAFDYYKTGNAIKRATFKYSIDAEVKKTEALKKVFTADFFNKNESIGCKDDTPIFILGMPRSGTTLVEQILSSHKDVFGAGELNNLRTTISNCLKKSLRDRLSEIAPKDFLEAGQAYIQSIREIDTSSRFITDKMPSNFRYVGLIKLILPQAKIIHCCRDPRDTCFSIFKNYFSDDGNGYAYDLKELGQFYNMYLELMGHWHQVLPGFVYDVNYEELVKDQEAQTRSLLTYLGLDWDDSCLKFYNSTRDVKTASAVQVRKPIYASSVNLWKHYEKELEPLFRVLNESNH